VILADAEPEPS
jgi:hypothetical protein